MNPDLLNFFFSEKKMVGGSITPLNLTLSADVPTTADTVLQLESSSELGLPATITVPAGQKSASVTVISSTVGLSTTAWAKVRSGAQDLKTATVTLNPIKVIAATGKVTAGQFGTVTLQLNATLLNDLTVTLSCDDPDITVPASVTAKGGDSSVEVPVEVSAYVTTTKGVLHVGINGNNYDESFGIIIPPAVKKIVLPNVIYGKQQVTGTVILEKPADDDGILVQLSAVGPLNVSYGVFVAPGQTTASFPITAEDVMDETGATLTASTGKPFSRTVTVKPNDIAALVFSSYNVKGGDSLTGTLTLKAPVSSDTYVLIMVNKHFGVTPTALIFHAGQKSVTFNLTTDTVTVPVAIKMTGRRNNQSYTRTFTIVP
ncbi:hypothetical protein BH11ARM2_BH11ARM2_19090 [soil metagenome]